MLALLSCQVSASSSTPGNYWTYFPDPPTFEVVTWSSDPIRVNTDQPRLLGGSYTSYVKGHYPINFNYTFGGLAHDRPEFSACVGYKPVLSETLYLNVG